MNIENLTDTELEALLFAAWPSLKEQVAEGTLANEPQSETWAFDVFDKIAASGLSDQQKDSWSVLILATIAKFGRPGYKLPIQKLRNIQLDEWTAFINKQTVLQNHSPLLFLLSDLCADGRLKYSASSRKFRITKRGLTCLAQNGKTSSRI